jgi:hypothetical protein
MSRNSFRYPPKKVTYMKPPKLRVPKPVPEPRWAVITPVVREVLCPQCGMMRYKMDMLVSGICIICDIMNVENEHRRWRIEAGNTLRGIRRAERLEKYREQREETKEKREEIRVENIRKNVLGTESGARVAVRMGWPISPENVRKSEKS